MSNLTSKKERIELGITKLAACEKVTKATLSLLSREVLTYVYATNDISIVNRLMQVLTPMNKRVAEVYFPKFLGWTFDTEALQFGTKQKAKQHNKKFELSCEFLADESHDIWTFAAEEITFAAKPKEYYTKIQQLVTRALSDADEGIDVKDVLSAIMASELVTLDDLLAPLGELKEAGDRIAA